MTNQPTDLVYIPVPVSEPPKEDGWYDLIDPLGEAQTFYFMEGEWYETEDEARQNENHDEVNVEGLLWLRPVSLSSLTNDRIKELEKQLVDSLKLYECQANTINKRDDRIKELEGKLRLAHDTGWVTGYGDCTKGKIIGVEKAWQKFKTENNIQ